MLINKIFSYGALFLAFLLLIIINSLSTYFFSDRKVDVTQEKIYSISEDSKKIVHDLKRPITLNFYYSPKDLAKIPVLFHYATYVKEMLHTYQHVAKGKIIVNIKKPAPFSKTAKEAFAYGLGKIPIDSQGTVTYLGLVGFDDKNKEEVIPLFVPEREKFLEYDLTKMIISLQKETKARLGVISSLPIFGEKVAGRRNVYAKSWSIWEQLNNEFTVYLLKNDIEIIPKSIDALVLIQPTMMTKKTFKAIDYYVHSGGRLIAFIEPTYNTADTKKINKDYFKNLQKLLYSWGVSFSNNEVVVDPTQDKKAWRLEDGVAKLVTKPFWFDIGNKLIDRYDPITANLENITFSRPGFFKIVDEEKMQSYALLQSSKKSLLVNKKEIDNYADDYYLFNKSGKISGERILGLRLRGKTKLAFYEPRVKSSLEERLTQKLYHHYSQLDGKETNIILFSDADFLQDKFWLIKKDILGEKILLPYASNGYLLLNSVENLVGNLGLLNIKPTRQYLRPLTKLVELQRDFSKKNEIIKRDLFKKIDNIAANVSKFYLDRKHTQLSQEHIHKQIALFKKEKSHVDGQIREIKFIQKQEIDNFINWLALLNVLLVPCAISLCGAIFIFLRRRRLLLRVK